MKMDETTVRQVLRRAEEIQHESTLDPNAADNLLDAAEEAGLSRDAVLRALQERMELSGTLQPGSLVFAKSGDGHYYVAELRKIEHGVATVEFVAGSEAKMPVSDVESFTLTPGKLVDCPWPNWGWWKCSVISYDGRRQKVLVSDRICEEKTFDLSEVRIRGSSPGPGFKMPPWFLLVGMTIGGGMVGALLMRLLMR